MHGILGIGTAGRFGIEMLRGMRVHVRLPEPPLAALPRRVAEQCILLGTNGIRAADYYRLGLQRPDLAWERKREFLGTMDTWRWMDRFNPPEYRFLTGDKLVFSRFMAQAGLPVPPLLGVFGPGGRAETGELLRTPADLATWMRQRQIENVVFKPARGNRGRGVLALGGRLGRGLEWRRMPEGRIDMQHLVAHLTLDAHTGGACTGGERTGGACCERWLVESRLRPNTQLAAYAADVLHTLRVVTLLEDDGRVEVIAAALRIGLGSLAADNFSAGNLLTPVDPASGRMGRAFCSLSGLMTRTSTHPVTGAPIEGQPVPDWERALALVHAAARVVPFDPLMGWDVGLASTGPVIVEGNDTWDFDVPQLSHGTGMLATRVRGELERRGALRCIGLGLVPPRSAAAPPGVEPREHAAPAPPEATPVEGGAEADLACRG